MAIKWKVARVKVPQDDRCALYKTHGCKDLGCRVKGFGLRVSGVELGV